MKTRLLFLGLLAAALFACETTEPETKEEQSKYYEDGFVISSVSQTTAGNSYYAGYYSSMPTGNIDITTKTSYNFLYTRAVWKNFIFSNNLKGENVLSKIAVSKETGNLVEVASLPLLGSLNQVLIISETLGVYTTWDKKGVALFNPATMQKITDVDMSKAKSSGLSRDNYSHVVYRKQDNKLFLFLVADNFDTGQFYDLLDVHAEVVNLNNNQWEKTLTFQNATYPIARGFDHPLIDEQGNIFVITQGQYGLDGQLGPNSRKGSRPKILKIPAGTTDFDPNYAFNPVDKIGQTNLMFQLVLGGIYYGNGIAYACISGQQDPPALLALIAKMANGTITETEYNQLRSLAFYGANQRWAKLDLNAQTATIIQDIPLTAGFAYPNNSIVNGKLYLQTYNEDLKMNGFYEHDPVTGTSKKVFDLTAGGMAVGFIKLTK
ncbi:hypothetical protein [Emticicia sp. 21SJ11W-3]|uniref:hypothetical protein n=1 Tax=Emticicia sp. 21SJ11W-3 TaxID=2916755 RepID=UPI0020A1C674|nr:hypothetical protein [Emticicia sp. 21SJ11W-3]UTA68080.1 hypothetical protein MB380_21170 [Emticicia sp. 21SJ11W-3]